MIGDNGEDHEITDSRIVSVKIGTLKITDIVNKSQKRFDFSFLLLCCEFFYPIENITKFVIFLIRADL